MNQTRSRGRRSIRIPGRDYTRENAYFVTVSTAKKICALGDIVRGVWVPCGNGRIAAEEWTALGNRFATVYLDAWVVMPNHLHGIIWLRAASPDQQGAQHGDASTSGKPAVQAPTHSDQSPGVAVGGKPLGQIVGAFKTAVMRRINQRDGTPGQTIWQRNFYERIVRDPAELERIRKYIRDNPKHWTNDAENLAQVGSLSPISRDV